VGFKNNALTYVAADSNYLLSCCVCTPLWA